MYQKDRLEDILAILKKHGYVTVKYLTEQLHYSTATINRDLNFLQNQRLVKRSYGGVELAGSKGTPLPFRYHKMRVAKSQIAKKAAEFIENGDVIFIDSTTTTQHIAPYITDRKDLTVITNNVAVVTYLSKYGVRVICLGGPVKEVPYMLYGPETIENAEKYAVDKMFFSAGRLTFDGRIDHGYHHLCRVVRKNAKQSYFLLDHQKVGGEAREARLHLRDVDVLISDYEFDDEMIATFPNVQFICVK